MAAKVIPMPKTDRRVWENEIAVYRLNDITSISFAQLCIHNAF